MGYRSEVKLILTDKGMNMLKAKVKQPTEDEPNWMADAVYEAIKIKDGRYWLIEWDDVKWYDEWNDYGVPCAVRALRSELWTMYEPFQFMRVGEDYADVEVDGDCDVDDMPHLELKREIEVEYYHE